MYAIIETGGKQYKVENGDRVVVEKLNVADGEAVVFDKVLVLADEAGVKVGTPYVEGVTVEKGVTVTAYPIVLATYDDNRNFSGYSVVNGYTINKINDPTQAELANIADIIKGGYAGITNANTNSYPLTANNGDGNTISHFKST